MASSSTNIVKDECKPEKMDISGVPKNGRGSITSSYLLSNLHCPSCVSHIQDILYALTPRPSSVSPSLVSSWVTVQHDRSLKSLAIREALEEAGFDVCDVTPEEGGKPSIGSHVEQDGDLGFLDQFLSTLRRASIKSAEREREAQINRHVENCDTCRREGQEAAGKRPSHASRSLPSAPQSSSSKTIHHESARGMRKSSKSEPLVVVDSAIPADTWRASLAIGGMTCAACVGTITEELKKKNWIQNVVVNLISNSATVDFDGEEHKNEIVDSIEDIGYEAAIDSVVDLKSIENPKYRKVQRTVDIIVNGMFCEHCPERVFSALETFGDRIKVEKPLSTQDPILTISYIPEAPNFTIRHIISKISLADESLEPSIYHPPTLEELSRKIHAQEQQRILVRVIFTLIVGIPTLLIGIIFMSLVPESNPTRKWFMHPLVAGVSRAQWVLFVMATPIYFLCADVFHIRTIKEVRAMWRPGSNTPILQRFYRFGSMNMLMSLGTTIAYVSSLAQLIASGVHPPLVPDESSFYFDSVVFLTLFLLVGRLIEAYSKSKTGDAVTMLGKLRPTEALLFETVTDSSSSTDNLITGDVIINGRQGESLRSVNVDLLEFGDVVKVLHGGSPPCDGVVISGQSRFDESSLTGEAKLIKKSVDDEVFSGTIIKDTPVSIKITGVAGSSMLDQIVKAVREGQTRRAPMERIADTLTGYFVPVVTLIAISTWIIWMSLGYSGVLPQSYLGSAGGWGAWSLQFAIAVFVVACPCGLALAAPTALFVGGGLAAQHGILAKGGGEAFEKASRLDCVVFDKTGTLTMGGEPVVTDFRMFPVDLANDDKEKTILGMVKAIEGNSSHTIAKAIMSFCKKKEAENIDAENVEEIPGGGMKASFNLPGGEDTNFIIGNEPMMTKNGLYVSEEVQQTLDSWKREGKSVAVAAIGLKSQVAVANGKVSIWKLAAIFAVSDPIRPEAPGIIAALHRRGTDVWMLSGDNYITATAIGRQVGIPSTNVIAGVLPGAKAEKIQYLQKSLKARIQHFGTAAEDTTKRAMVAMVGDGINDSPALTTADVGIAIGSGSDIAISSAEFVLVSSNLNALITLLDLSKLVFRRIKFNFGWALVYNLVALPVAAGALYPIISNGQHLRLDPVWASLAMALSSISVVCSSLALRSGIPGIGFRARRKEE